jgi:hypothetical protein
MGFIIVKLESLISDRTDDIKSILPEDFFFLLFRMSFQDRLRGDLKHPFGSEMPAADYNSFVTLQLWASFLRFPHI